jgi:hypothetical protein
MKNEPVVTYNHMEEDDSSNGSQSLNTGIEKSSYPISLYMIFIVDIILIAGVVYIAMKTIF